MLVILGLKVVRKGLVINMEEEKQFRTYLILLEDSLMKKSKVLEQLIHLTKEQELLFKEENYSDQEFDRILDEKDVLIQSLLKLDDGFEQIYQNVKEGLAVKGSAYKETMIRLQELIKLVIDKGVLLTALENQTKNKLELYIQTKRKNIRNYKLNSQSVTSYYKNMANQHQGQSYFMDKKN